jgi:hypothetical protein
LRKNTVKAILVLMLVLCLSINAAAITPGESTPQASLYLSFYSVDLLAIGNGEMGVDMFVVGTGTMSKIGVYSLFIEQKINGTWQEYDTVYGILQSDFYEYNDYSYVGEYSFTGVAGRQYRVTMTAYAGNSTGSDTGDIMSGAVTCRNP